MVDTVYVNKVPVTEKGLVHGDSLSSTLAIGTSIPLDGLVVPGGESVNIYLWIGSDKYTKGISIQIEVQKKDSIGLMKILTLN